MPEPVIAPLVRDAVGDQWGILEGVPVARRVGLAAPITQNAGLSLEGEAGVFPSLALRTLMHLEAQKRGGRPITAAVDHRRGLILLRDESRALVRAIPIVDDDMNMIVGVASRQELAPDLFHEVFANATHPDRLVRFKGRVVIVGYTSADDRWDVSAGQGDARYGVELQASAVSNLLGGIAIKPLAAVGAVPDDPHHGSSWRADSSRSSRRTPAVDSQCGSAAWHPPPCTFRSP